MNDIFQIASRNQFRFPSSNGLLTTEDLWGLPLKSDRKNAANLNDIAIALHREVKSSETESFVDDVPKANKATQVKLEIVKAVIAYKKAQAAAAEARAQNAAQAAQAAQIREILAKKQVAALEGTDAAKLQEMLANLTTAPAPDQEL